MGLFSGLTEIAGGLIGTAVGGPAGGALGSSLGGIVGNQLDNNRTGRLNNRQAKKDYALHRKRFEHTVADAKAAGIHPLEALRSGGANTSPNYTPRLQTTNARDQDFDTIQSVLTGEYAENRSRDRLNDELTRVDIDNARRGRIPKSGPGPNTDLRPPKFDADGNPIPRKENYLVEVWNPLSSIQKRAKWV